MTDRVHIESNERLMWAGLTVVLFAIACAVAYRPSLAHASDVYLAILPSILIVLTLAGLLSSKLRHRIDIAIANMLVVLGVWLLLMINNDNWSIFSFAMYPVCFVAAQDQVRIGLSLSALTSAVWAAGWLFAGAPYWTVVIPLGAFVVSAVMTFTFTGVERLNREQAALIAKLQHTQDDLAASERSKGILEERARMASEIHDTLAQGFTSIILTSRAAQRVGEAEEALTAVEDIAQENLDAARRLVEALQPPELTSASLGEAIDRQISAALPDDVASELRIVGEPRPLAGAVEVTMLRGAQEALLNVRNHAQANQVDVTLSYLKNAVVLDVRDDGVGFIPDIVNDRGSLTGGQGLDVLRQRAQSLEGQMTIEANEGGGSVVSLLLPVAGA